MNKFSLAFSLVVISFLFIGLSSCKKLNEATELGSELIPAVDNIHTFDTVLNVETYNGIFTEAEDSARNFQSSLQFLGTINQDPLFGKTEASMFFQLMPGTTKYTFPFAKTELISLDSIVLVLGYNHTYGDTMLPQQVAVYEIPTTTPFHYDSSYLLRNNNFPLGAALSPVKTFIPQTLNDSVFPYHESAANQLRIPLDNSFGMRLLTSYDTSSAYASDSAFKTYFNGFAVVPQNNTLANSLVGFNLSDTNTKLCFYVRYNSSGKTDTSVIKFNLTSQSATANYINRDYTGAELLAHQDPSTPSDLVYIQNSPGTYATLKIPGLRSLSNRIVHRAELIVEQVADPIDDKLAPPTYLFLDAYDSTQKKYRTIPYDFTVASGTFNSSAFGMIGKTTTDIGGNNISVWKFDLSRYIQHVVNQTEPVYSFRLLSPYLVKEIYRNVTTDIEQSISINPFYAAGRVRVGGGNHPTQPMRLRIIYSRLEN